MYYSRLFGRTLREAPKDAETINQKLLVQAGYVDQLMAGVYTYLPLGLRVLTRISDIVRHEMDEIGSNEILMPMLHPKANWEATGAWDSVDVLFKLKSRTDKEYALGQSEEEVVTPLARDWVHSYKELPASVYQIHWKFRDELRSKSGLLRGREFLMKDMYSFHETYEDFLNYYEVVKKAYLKAFAKLGLVAKVTEASGGNFTDKMSYEFMVLTDAGEDDILYCSACDFCVNIEIAKVKEGEKCTKCNGADLQKARASEVGNVFDLGQKNPKCFNFSLQNKAGESFYPYMGCYGFGISRTMGVLVEKLHDDKGIVWPKSVAPFKAHLISIGQNSKAEEVYQKLKEEGVEVLYDDRDTSAGEKFKDADLIGLPIQLIVSQKSLEAGGVEVKYRDGTDSKVVDTAELPGIFK